MRYKFIILFLFISFVSKAQVYQLMPQYGYSTYRMNFDSTIQIPTFCGVPKLGSNKINKGALAFDSCNNRFYFFNPKSQAWDTIKSGSTVDTTKFVRYTDTSAMLLPYLKKQDTVSLSNRIEGRIDSLKLSNDSIYARKNSQFVFQYMNDTATVVKASVRNSESFTINRGQVVYIFGASGDKASVKLADNSGDITSARTLGFVREDIASGQTGWVTTQGQVSKLQLGAYNEGDILWLDSIPGGFTKTKPVAPRHSVFLGVVERANNGNGIAYVKPQNGYELGELHDVKITSPQTNEVLAYTTNIWENKNIYSIVDTTSLSDRINTKLNISDTANTWVTSVFRKTASDSVFFVRGGTNNFAFRDSAGGGGWGLLGNSGTSDVTNFIGTTDNQDLVFRRNNVISGRIDSSSVNFGSTTFGFGTRGTSISTNGITAFGYKALGSNIAIGSTGISNTAFGNRALTANTTGSSCTAIGHNALATNAGINDQTAVGAFSLENAGGGGGGHTALGTFALRNATFGSANTAVGAYSLRDITSQNFNTAIGNQSGLYFGGSTSNSLTNATSSTFIGYQTYAGANSQSNQTVIGQGATGAGSNTVTLGDNNITATYLKGTLGLGRTWTSSAPSVAASALLDMSSTTRGFLQPRMTNSEMNAISTPATGLSVFNTTDSTVYIRRGATSGWQQVANEIVNTGTLDFPSTNAQNSSDLTITLTGAVDGDAVVLGVPNAAVNANSCYTAWVSANNQITVRFNNYSSGAIDPASATFRVTIIK